MYLNEIASILQMNYDKIINKYEQNMFAMSIIYFMIVNRRFGQFYGAFQS